MLLLICKASASYYEDVKVLFDALFVSIGVIRVKVSGVSRRTTEDDCCRLNQCWLELCQFYNAGGTLVQFELFRLTNRSYHKTSPVKKKKRKRKPKSRRKRQSPSLSWPSWHVVCVTAKCSDAVSVSVWVAWSPQILGSALCQTGSGACPCKWKTRGSPFGHANSQVLSPGFLHFCNFLGGISFKFYTLCGVHCIKIVVLLESPFIRKVLFDNWTLTTEHLTVLVVFRQFHSSFVELLFLFSYRMKIV